MKNVEDSLSEKNRPPGAEVPGEEKDNPHDQKPEVIDPPPETERQSEDSDEKKPRK